MCKISAINSVSATKVPFHLPSTEHRRYPDQYFGAIVCAIMADNVLRKTLPLPVSLKRNVLRNYGWQCLAQNTAFTGVFEAKCDFLE